MKCSPLLSASGAILLAVAVDGCSNLLAPFPPAPTIFQQMDTNRDGKISRAEFSTGFADAMLMVYNLDRDGTITPTQWNAVERPARAGSSFQRLDVNHDGKLSRAEMSSGQERDAVVNEFFDRIDKNHDGFISPEEGHKSQLDITPRERAQRVRP